MEEPFTGAPSAASLEQRARALLDAKRPGEAIPLLHRALSLEPGGWQSLCLLSFAYLQVNQPADALRAAGDAAAAAPASDWPHRLRASALIKLGRAAEALVVAQQAVAVNPAIPEPYLLLSEAEIANRHLGPAREAAERARELAPERPGGHVALSIVELKARRWIEAERHSRAALAIDPENTAALNNLGVALQGLGRRREAVHYLGTASRLDPRNPLYKRNAIGAARRFGGLALVAIVAVQFLAGNLVGGFLLASVMVALRVGFMAAQGNLAGLWRTPLERWRRRKMPSQDPQASAELLSALRREGRRMARGAGARRRRVRDGLVVIGLTLVLVVLVDRLLVALNPATGAADRAVYGIGVLAGAALAWCLASRVRRRTRKRAAAASPP
ncbi:MAG: hypothetical protein NVSMB32_01890 [Actinomycetota bacterium]